MLHAVLPYNKCTYNPDSVSCQKLVTEMTRGEMEKPKSCDLHSLWTQNNKFAHTYTQWPRQWTHPCGTHKFEPNVSRHAAVAVTITSVCVCVWHRGALLSRAHYTLSVRPPFSDPLRRNRSSLWSLHHLGSSHDVHCENRPFLWQRHN